MDNVFLYANIVLIVLGTLLIAVGLIGGGLEIDGIKIKVPKLPIFPRIGLGAFGGVLLIIGIILSLPFLSIPPTPNRQLSPVVLMPTPTGIPTATPGPPTDFSVTEVKLKSGKILQIGQPYPVTESPITITGTCSSQGSGNVWVVVVGGDGRLYLQQPPVQFINGHQWMASNIVTAAGAVVVKFVYVTPQGQNIFQTMVDTGSYVLASLPDGSKVVMDIPIQVIQD